jgi:hypothetical protein
MGGLDSGKVQLARGERRELCGRLVHHHHDEALQPGRSSELGRERRIGGKDPPAIRLVRHETERAVAHWRAIPGSLAQAGRRYRVQEVSGKNRQVGKEIRKPLLPLLKSQAHGRVVYGHDRPKAGELARTRVPGGWIPRRVQSPCNVACDGWPAVVPADRGVEMKGERSPVGRPFPPAREIWPRRKRAVVARQRGEQHVALDLLGKRVDGEERVNALKIRARGKEHGGTPPFRDRAAGGKQGDKQQRDLQKGHGEF